MYMLILWLLFRDSEKFQYANLQTCPKQMGYKSL